MNGYPCQEDEETERAELAALLPAPGVRPLGAGRHRELREGFVREIERRAAERASDSARRYSWHRLSIVVVPLAVVALAVAALSVRAVGQGDSPPAGPTDGEQAAQVLHQAAAALDGRPPVPVRADQFVYVRHLGKGHVLGFGLRGFGQREDWFPANGKPDALIRVTPLELGAATRLGRYPPTARSETGANSAVPPWRADRLRDLPTDPTALRAWLYERTEGQGGDRGQVVFELIASLLDIAALEPDLNAALYRVASRLPGVTVTERVADGAGRHGVGLTFRFPDTEPTTWVFDTQSLAYLGTKNTALLDVTVVDRRAQVPRGPTTHHRT
ncbi:CU044_5270 family protein [Streptomyces sp. NPDC057702]|uniref:CU044_5270 family protein n=1 Tax=unclassified Streptomyces TaxID=2593676 RepID=UPI0036BDE2C6